MTERFVDCENDLKHFYDACMDNRSTSSTKLNDRSSRSHAIFTVAIHRTMVEVMGELGSDLKAKVVTTTFTSKFHLVDLAGAGRQARTGAGGGGRGGVQGDGSHDGGKHARTRCAPSPSHTSTHMHAASAFPPAAHRQKSE